jgi:hypothetical protein
VNDLAADPATTPGPPARRSHRPWSTLLLSTYVVAAILTSAGCLLALGLLAAAGKSQSTGVWDGLGETLALMAAGFMATVCAASIAFTVLTRKGRRRADDGNPSMLRATSSAGFKLGIPVILLAGSSLVTGAGFPQAVPLAVLTMAALWMFANARVLRATGGFRLSDRMPTQGC